jgi:hypothetical protein
MHQAGQRILTRLVFELGWEAFSGSQAAADFPNAGNRPRRMICLTRAGMTWGQCVIDGQLVVEMKAIGVGNTPSRIHPVS